MPRPYASAVVPRPCRRGVEWSAEYDADGADEAGLNELFAGGVFGAGLAALQQRFSG